MLENIEKIIRHAGELHIEPERYGAGIMVCLDILTSINNATDEQDGTICYLGTEVFDAVYAASSPGDIHAINTFEKLEKFSEMHPEFLYARGNTLNEALDKLEKRALLWNKLTNGPYITSKLQDELLLGFVEYIKNLEN